MTDGLRGVRGVAALNSLTLLISSGTLLCCVLPAVMVSIGAGAALAGLVSAVPQLVWLSMHKVWLFALAAVLLVGSGLALRIQQSLPCPSDPVAGRQCARLRAWSKRLWWTALIATGIGALFAFVIPKLL